MPGIGSVVKKTHSFSLWWYNTGSINTETLSKRTAYAERSPIDRTSIKPGASGMIGRTQPWQYIRFVDSGSIMFINLMTLGAMPCCRRLSAGLATCVLYHPGQMGKKVAVGEVLPLVLRFPTISIIPPILHTHLIVIDTKEPHQITALLTSTKLAEFYTNWCTSFLKGVLKFILKQLRHVSV
jgi:hypothetical protein